LAGVGRADLDASSPTESFIGSSNVCGVAVDGTHIYWTDASPVDGIGRANINGTGVEQQFITGASLPCGVAVDGAHIYWANQGPMGTGTTIGRANLDGTGVDQSFITGASAPCGIAVDSTHIYWANWKDGGGTSIGRANLNGTGVDQSFIATNNPCGMAVDDGHIYWTSGNVSTPPALARANLDGTNVQRTFVPDSGGGCAVGVDGRSLAPSFTALAVSKDPSTFGDPLAFRALVADGSSSPTVPTGGVQIAVDGANIDGPVPLDGGGQAIFSLTFPLDVGSTMTASYLGDNNHSESAARFNPTIQPAGTATSLTSSANPANEGGEVTISATTRNVSTGVTPFGSVQFLIDGTPVLGPQPLDGQGETGIVGSNLGAGDIVVTANYHDDTAAIADFMDSQASFTQHVNGQSSSAPRPASIGVGPVPPSATPIAQPADVALIAGKHPKTRLRGPAISVDTDEVAVCPAGGPGCSASLRAQTTTTGRAAKVKPRRTITIGSATVSIPAGTHAELVFTLNRRGVKLLRSRKRLSATLTTTTSAGGGSSHAFTTRLTLRLPKSARAADRLSRFRGLRPATDSRSDANAVLGHRHAERPPGPATR
jgi:hypothetical protein